jgi:hypothetical protein
MGGELVLSLEKIHLVKWSSKRSLLWFLCPQPHDLERRMLAQVMLAGEIGHSENDRARGERRWWPTACDSS